MARLSSRSRSAARAVSSRPARRWRPDLLVLTQRAQHLVGRVGVPEGQGRPRQQALLLDVRRLPVAQA